jgi:FlaA1/EpsC-like NDP-sugar epimerase
MYRAGNKRMKKKIRGSNMRLAKELNGKTILITGGAGSVGAFLIKRILQFPVKAVRVLDIDEHALFRLNRSIRDERLRSLLGSITDKERVEMAGNKVDIVIHLAAIKNIEITEFNPIETIETNINGMVNLIKMSMRNKPGKFLNISTDKAVGPSTLYGTTKYLSEQLTTWAAKHITDTKFASVRFGNVIETRGNVFEVWKQEQESKSYLSITDPSMKRYFFHINEAVDFILQCSVLIKSGEIFVPKMKSYKIKDLAWKISKKHRIIGMRQGEKLEEVLITKEEMKTAVGSNSMWIIRK